LAKIIIASQFSELTNNRQSWISVADNAQSLIEEIRLLEPLLFNAIVGNDNNLKPFVSLVIDEMPCSDEENLEDVKLGIHSTILILSAVAGG